MNMPVSSAKLCGSLAICESLHLVQHSMTKATVIVSILSNCLKKLDPEVQSHDTTKN